MQEYEYSFKVENLDKYIKYCEDHNYVFIEQNKETRTIYRHENKTMARITTKEKNNIKKNVLDFKEDKLEDKVLIERKESLGLEFDSIESVLSILDFLDYKKDNTLVRTRTVYQLNNVKFELDSYKEPEEIFVVAIEGEKSEVDKVYQELKKNIT